MRKLANSVNDKLLIFIPLSKKHSCLSEFNMSRALKSEQKEAIFTLVLEKTRNGSRRSLFGLVTQHALLLTGNRGRCETRLNNSCDNSGRGTDTFYFCLGVFFCYKTDSVRNTKFPILTLPAKIMTLACYACLCLSSW